MKKLLKKIKNLAFQGDIGFLKNDQYIARGFNELVGKSIEDVLADTSSIIKTKIAGKNPFDAFIHPEKGMVLAQGESRNHYHAFRNADEVVVHAANDNLRLLLVRTPQTLVHEEHDGIKFDAGLYIQGGQFEYGFTDEIEEYRRVAD